MEETDAQLIMLNLAVKQHYKKLLSLWSLGGARVILLR